MFVLPWRAPAVYGGAAPTIACAQCDVLDCARLRVRTLQSPPSAGWGTASQIAYWFPALLLVLALRRLWMPLLIMEIGALIAVGATMFWYPDLSVHLGAIAASVVATVIVLAPVPSPAPERPVLA